MEKILLNVDKVTKKFPGVKALDQVHFDVKEGEIHCLVGENGAGKSTLMNIISGIYPAGSYEGRIEFNGNLSQYHTIRESESDGIVIIHQELALCSNLTIFENIFLGNENQKVGVINWNETLNRAKQLLKRVSLNENPTLLIDEIGVGKQQLVEIAKALSKRVKLLIFDEPTASLNDEESDHLLDLILSLKKEGITSIMISHKLKEVFKISDRITILRDGKTIKTYDLGKEPVNEEQVIKDMVGRELTQRFPERTSHIGDLHMEVKEWTAHHPLFSHVPVVKEASLHVRYGEIIGICGLMGSGRTELAMSLFGRAYGSRHQGEILIDGKPVSFKTPKEAIAHNMIYVSEDRKELGLILIQDVRTNISNSSLKLLSRWGVVDSNQEILEAEKYRERLAIKTPGVEQIVENLSGGNQQKVVLSRCLLSQPSILIVDEPTRGIDVGAKYEIYTIMNDFVSQGNSIIMISSELPEIIGMSDRIYVMNEGRILDELPGKEATQEKIMEIAIGH